MTFESHSLSQVIVTVNCDCESVTESDWFLVRLGQDIIMVGSDHEDSQANLNSCSTEFQQAQLRSSFLSNSHSDCNPTWKSIVLMECLFALFLCLSWRIQHHIVLSVLHSCRTGVPVLLLRVVSARCSVIETVLESPPKIFSVLLWSWSYSF